MKAVVFDQCGEPADVLEAREVEPPVAKHGHVLVRMICCPVNPSDLMFIRGRYTLPTNPPAIPGFEGVGIVEQAGGGFRSKIMKGRRVAVLNRKGGNWAEHTVVPADQVIPVSKSLSVEQAATFFVNPATAYIMTRQVLQIPSGAYLLQSAAGSVLGRMIIRLGKTFGFKTICLVRRSEQVDELKQLGADEVLRFDDNLDQSELESSIMQITSNAGVHSAVDAVGGATGSAMIRCLGRNGRQLQYGTLSGKPVEFAPRDIMTPAARIEGFWLGNYMQSLSLMKKLSLVKAITRLIRSGELDSEIGEHFELENIREAVVQAEQSGRGGKTLLSISEV